MTAFRFDLLIAVAATLLAATAGVGVQILSAFVGVQ